METEATSAEGVYHHKRWMYGEVNQAWLGSLMLLTTRSADQLQASSYLITWVYHI